MSLKKIFEGTKLASRLSGTPINKKGAILAAHAVLHGVGKYMHKKGGASSGSGMQGSGPALHGHVLDTLKGHLSAWKFD